MNNRLLSVENLHIAFRTYAGRVYAVNGMTFHINRNEIFGLVGESGCGKSMTAMAILNLVPHGGEITQGRILFEGKNILDMNENEMHNLRGRRIAMIFQDPTTSLNPVFTVGYQTVLVITQHMKISPEQARQRALEMYEAVALPDPQRIYRT